MSENVGKFVSVSKIFFLNNNRCSVVKKVYLFEVVVWKIRKCTPPLNFCWRVFVPPVPRKNKVYRILVRNPTKKIPWCCKPIKKKSTKVKVLLSLKVQLNLLVCLERRLIYSFSNGLSKDSLSLGTYTSLKRKKNLK